MAIPTKTVRAGNELTVVCRLRNKKQELDKLPDHQLYTHVELHLKPSTQEQWKPDVSTVGIVPDRIQVVSDDQEVHFNVKFPAAFFKGAPATKATTELQTSIKYVSSTGQSAPGPGHPAGKIQVTRPPRNRVFIIAGLDNDFPPSVQAISLTADYFLNAWAYWRFKGQAPIQILHLQGILDYLTTSPKRGTEPWGEVHIISHATSQIWFIRRRPETGNAMVDNNNWRTTEERLRSFTASMTAAIPGPEILDEQSNIIVRACHLGTNGDMLRAVRDLFGERPTTWGCRVAVCYQGGTTPHELLMEGNDRKETDPDYAHSTWFNSMRKGK